LALSEALEAAKIAVEALQDSEERHRAVVENAEDGIITIDEQGHVESINPAAEKAFGYSALEIIGKNIKLLMPEPISQKHDGYLQSYVETGETRIIGRGPRELEGLRKDGSHFPMELVVAEMHVAGRRLFLGVVRDMSIRKEAQEAIKQKDIKLQEAEKQLMQSEKMASIGQLAAGVAHEINNPIGYINSNIGTLEQYIEGLFCVLEAYAAADSLIDQNSDLFKSITKAKQQADIEFLKEDMVALMTESQEGVTRVKQIVQDLKDFSHVDQVEWQTVDLHKGINSTLNIVRNEIKYKAEVVNEYGELPMVECIPSQLNQVFMNLLINASHAIDEHGLISIATGKDGDNVWVDIRDTGKGIAKENIDRIFEPFFTTKPVGSGTGLGLSLSYGIIRKHGGEIEVKSVVGQGTTFRVWLPIKQAEI